MTFEKWYFNYNGPDRLESACKAAWNAAMQTANEHWLSVTTRRGDGFYVTIQHCSDLLEAERKKVSVMLDSLVSLKDLLEQLEGDMLIWAGNPRDVIEKAKRAIAQANPHRSQSNGRS